MSSSERCTERNDSTDFQNSHALTYIEESEVDLKISVLLPASSGRLLRLLKGIRGVKAVLLCLI